MNSDPYIFEEKDPLKSNALNSSLWELVSLKQHVLPQVGKSVSFLSKKLPNVEWDISELLDDSYESVSENRIFKINKLNIGFSKFSIFLLKVSLVLEFNMYNDNYNTHKQALQKTEDRCILLMVTRCTTHFSP